MLPNFFIYIAIAIRLFGGSLYLRATLNGRAQPSPISWLLWGTTPIIAYAAELSAGVGLPALATLALGVTPMAVFLAAMHKNPQTLRLDTTNIICIVLALLGIALWRASNEPNIAILMMIFIDTVSCWPTMRKIWRLPKSEYIPTYLLSMTSMAVTLLTIKTWNFATYGFPAYILFMNGFLVLYMLLARRLSPHRKKRSYRRPYKARTRPIKAY